MQNAKLKYALALSLLAATASIPAMSVAYAVGDVWTTNASNVIVHVFGPGETVYIHWNMEHNGNEIDVMLPDASTVTVATGVGSTGTIAFTDTTQVGPYMVLVLGPGGTVTLDFAIGTFRVVPEFALGTVAALGVSLIGFRMYKKRSE